MSLLDQAVDTLLNSAGLEPEQAKLAVYYSIATWKMPQLDMFPILRFCGPPGTGKSSTMRVMGPWCCDPTTISGKRITVAALRDRLGEAHKGTALIEEADETADAKGCEELLSARCSPLTGQLQVKRAQNSRTWRQCSVSIYGASIVHYRGTFIDQATASRCITITTCYRDGRYKPPASASDLAPLLKGLAEVTDLSEVAELGSGRVHDVWAPLLAVAKLAHDESWLEWARERMEKDTEDLRDGHAYELDGLILAKIVECLTDEKTGQIVCRQLCVQGDIVQPLRYQERMHISAWQASRQLKELGFDVQRIGGKNKFMPTSESLRRAAEKTGYRDEVLQ